MDISSAERAGSDIMVLISRRLCKFTQLLLRRRRSLYTSVKSDKVRGGRCQVAFVATRRYKCGSTRTK